LVLAAETICVLTGMLPLFVGYTQSRLIPAAVGCFVIGLFWIYSERRGWHWVAPAGLFVFVIAAGAGVWIRLPPILMALSVLGSLMAWDLAGFSRRSKDAAPEDDLRSLEKSHLLQLASLGAAGLVLILAAMLINLRISFGWMFLLVLAAMFGIMQMVRRYRG
jgi:hypothetical protein